jgi:nicotinamide mononucleotide transporter
MSPLELAANLVTTVSILLAGRNSIQTWWTGIVGGALFAALFFESQLYADVALQGFFIATSVAGWARWRAGNGDSAGEIPVTRTSRGTLALSALAALVTTAVYGAMLHRYTNAYAPFWDSFVLSASVVAQFLLLNRKLESWYFWLLVNTAAVPLYCSRGLWLTGALYAAYWINALVSARRWRELAA